MKLSIYAICFITIAHCAYFCQQYGEINIICEEAKSPQKKCSRCQFILGPLVSDTRVCYDDTYPPPTPQKQAQNCANAPELRFCPINNVKLLNEIDKAKCNPTTYLEIDPNQIEPKSHDGEFKDYPPYGASYVYNKMLKANSGIKKINNNEADFFAHKGFKDLATYLQTDFQSDKWLGVTRPNSCSTIFISGPQELTITHGPSYQLGTIYTDTSGVKLGLYNYKMRCLFKDNNWVEQRFDVTIFDSCQFTQPTSPSIAPFNIQYGSGAYSIQLQMTDFFLPDLVNGIECEPHSCIVVDSLTSTNALSYFQVSFQSNPSITLEVDSNSFLAIATYYLRCVKDTTQQVTQDPIYSNGFDMRVDVLSCVPFVSFQQPSNLIFDLPVLNQGSAKTQIYDGSYITTSLPSHCPLAFALKTAGGTNYVGTDTISAQGAIEIDQTIENVETIEIHVTIKGAEPTSPEYSFTNPLFIYTKKVECKSSQFTLSLPSITTYDLEMISAGSSRTVLPFGTYILSSTDSCVLSFSLSHTSSGPYTGQDSVNLATGLISFDQTVESSITSEVHVKINGHDPSVPFNAGGTQASYLFTYTRSCSCLSSQIIQNVPTVTEFHYQVAALGTVTTMIAAGYVTSQVNTCILQFHLQNSDGSAYTGGLAWDDQIAANGAITFKQEQEHVQTMRVIVTVNNLSRSYLADPLFTYTRILICGPLNVVFTAPAQTTFNLEVLSQDQPIKTLFDGTYLTSAYASACGISFELRNHIVISGPSDQINPSSGAIIFDQNVESSQSAEVYVLANGILITGIPNPLFTYSKTVLCGPLSIDLNRISPSNPQSQEINIVPVPFFEFDEHQTNQDACPVQSYELFTDTSATQKPNQFETAYSVSAGKVSFKVLPQFVRLARSYTFSIRINIKGGSAWVQDAGGSTLMQLNVLCGPDSSIITDEGYFPDGFFPYQPLLSDIQLVDVSLTTTYFILPIFTTQTGDCGINQRYIVPTNPFDETISGAYATYNLNQFAQETSFGSLEWLATPIDKSLHQVYQFFVKVYASNNQVLKYSSQLTFVVGCVQAFTTITVDPQFQTQVTTIVGVFQIEQTAYSFLQQENTPQYCTLTHYELLNTDGSTIVNSNVIFTNAVQPNNQLKLQQVNDKFSQTLIIRTHLVGGVFFDSVPVKFDHICSNISQTITSNINQFEYEFINMYGNNKLQIPQHSVNFPTCGSDLNYSISLSASLPPINDTSIVNLIYLDLDPASVTYQQVVVEINNMQVIPLTTLYIHAQNKFGTYATPIAISIKIKYNCMNFDRLLINEKLPQDLEVQQFPKNLVFNETQQLLIYENTVGNFTNETYFDLSERVQNNASSYCFVKELKISKVMMGNLTIPNTQWMGLLEIDGFSLKFINYEWAYGPYSVYVEAYNSFTKIQNLTFPVISIKINPVPFVPPNTAPFLISAVQDFTLNLQMFESNVTQFDLRLPAVKDIDLNDTVNITTRYLPEFMNFWGQNLTMTIDFTKLKQEDLRIYPLEFIVQDDKGGKRSYQFSIDITNQTIAKQFQVPKFIPTSQELTPLIEIVKPKLKEQAGEVKTEIVSAFIKSVSILGEVVIEFSHVMKTDFNLTMLNSTFVDMFIEPAEDRHMNDENFNLSSLNFTWETTYYYRQTMKLQLTFNDVYAISPLPEQDLLVFQIKDPAFFFFSPELMKDIDKKYQILKKSMKKQLQNTELNQMFLSQTEIGEQSLDTMLVATVGVGFLTSLALSALTFYLRSLQMIIHLPLLHIIMPPNVSTLFNKLIPTVTFDVLESEYTTEVLLDFEYEKHREVEIEIFDQIRDLGYETHNAIFNLGSLFVFQCAIILMLGLYIILKLITVVTGKRFKLEKTLKHELFFKFPVSLFLEAYFEWLISGILQQKTVWLTLDGEILGQVFGWIGLFFTVIVMPLLFVRFLRFPLRYFPKVSFQKKWGNFFVGVSNRSKGAISYYLVYMLRRIHFVFLAFFADKMPTIQILMVMYSNLIIGMYLSHYKPLISRPERRLEQFNELTITLVTLHELFFTDWVPSMEDQIWWGWSMIIIIIINMIFNIIVVLLTMIHALKLLYRKYLPRIKRSFQKKQEPLPETTKIEPVQETPKEMKKLTPFEQELFDLEQKIKEEEKHIKIADTIPYLTMKAKQLQDEAAERMRKRMEEYNEKQKINPSPQARTISEYLESRSSYNQKKSKSSRNLIDQPKSMLELHADSYYRENKFENPFNKKHEQRINSIGLNNLMHIQEEYKYDDGHHTNDFSFNFNNFSFQQ